MKRFTKSAAVLGIAAIALLGSCGKGGDNTSSKPSNTSSQEHVTGPFYVTLLGKDYEDVDNSVNLSIGETMAVLVPHSYEETELQYTFASSNDAIVSVNAFTGIMTPKAAGTADVTVSLSNDAESKIVFHVTVAAASVAKSYQSYTSVKNDDGKIDYDEKSRILGTLEKYAVDNYLTGITLFSNGSKILYNDRYVPLPKSYVTGYGWGTSREGSFQKNDDGSVKTLPGGALGGHPDYYTIGTSSLPSHANAMNASGSDVSMVSEYISNSFYETRLNVTNDGYEWYPKLANDNRPLPIDDEGNVIDANDPRAENNSRWRIHVKTGANTGGKFVYRTASTATKDGKSVAAFDGRQVTLEDYLTPIKLMLTNWNGQYRGSEMTDGVSGFAGASSYFNATSTNTTGDATALWDNAKWNKYMGDNIKTGNDAGGDYIEFNLLQPCTQFYAMYYLSSSLYSPIPADFIKLWGAQKLGKAPDGYTPKDTMISSGPYYITDWGDVSLTFKNNDRYFYTKDEDGDFASNPRNVYNLAGFQYNIVQQTDMLKNYFLSGQIDSYAPNKADLAGDMKGNTGTGSNGTKWIAYQTKGDSNFKLNVNASTAEQWKKRFGKSGTIYQHSADNPTDGSYSSVKPYMSDIHFLNFLSFALDREAICTSRGMTPTQEYFSDNYIIDPEKGISYNATDAHKAVLANRYNETYGYNHDAAVSELKQVFEGVLKELSNAGKLSTDSKGTGTPGTKTNPYLVPIDMFWMNPTDTTDYSDVFDSIKKIFDEVSQSKLYNGRYKLQINEPTPSTDYQKVYDRMKQGDFDIGFGAISGNALNPLNFIEVLKSDNSSGFTLNWGPDTSEVSDDIVYDGKKWSFDALWAAGNSGTVLTNEGKIAQVQNVSSALTAGLYKYESADQSAQSVTYKVSFKQLIEGGAKIENVKDLEIAVVSASASKVFVLNGAGDAETTSLNITAATDWTGNITIDKTFNTIKVQDNSGAETDADNNVVTLKVTYKIEDEEHIVHTFNSSITLLTYKGIMANTSK